MKASAHKLICMLFVYLAIPNSASAAVTHYQTPFEQAKWNFSGDVFYCQLQHKIQGFGQLKLIALPGEELKLQLNTDWLSLNNKQSQAHVIASPWQLTQQTDHHSTQLWWLGNTATSQNNINPFLEGLDQGQSWQVNITSDNGAIYQVNASAVNTKAVVNQFRHCRQALLPKPFSYVRRIDFQFETGSSQLNSHQDIDLNAIVRYVLADSSIKEILVDGHADAVGEHLANLVLSKERADEIASRLVELGLSSKMIQVRNHGARAPKASNNNDKGRLYNRRVTVRLVKASTRVAQTATGDKINATY
ncbi:MotY family protein [Shewanella surugensis]|uniref:OmpA family protein n=1 Tax=Shewanella surugensis TaxID=212020 RepID=A0ABT0LAR9_9GAMM|nr:OmpA family protein [Shewanella surugensis]MCL1124804.1 OmpA family protein [Shewanella surugensis]